MSNFKTSVYSSFNSYRNQEAAHKSHVMSHWFLEHDNSSLFSGSICSHQISIHYSATGTSQDLHNKGVAHKPASPCWINATRNYRRSEGKVGLERCSYQKVHSAVQFPLNTNRIQTHILCAHLMHKPTAHPNLRGLERAEFPGCIQVNTPVHLCTAQTTDRGQQAHWAGCLKPEEAEI